MTRAAVKVCSYELDHGGIRNEDYVIVVYYLLNEVQNLVFFEGMGLRLLILIQGHLET